MKHGFLSTLLLAFLICVAAQEALAQVASDKVVLGEDGAFHGLGYMPPPPGMQALRLQAVHPKPEGIKLPAFTDNSDYLPPVGNQGQQGSCVAFALGYYCKSYAETKEHGWTPNDASHQFSPAYIYNQAQCGVDQGMYPSDAVTLMQELGACSLSWMPFNSHDSSSWPSESAYREALRHRIGAGYFLGTAEVGALDAIRNLLSSGRVGAIGIFIYGNFGNIASYGYNYCLHDVTDSCVGAHLVTVVGYDDARATADGVGALRCVNSWGTEWGEGGFFWLSYQAATDPGLVIDQGNFFYFDDLPDDDPGYAARITLDFPCFRALSLSLGTGDPSAPATSKSLFDFLSYTTGTPCSPPPGWPIWVDLTPVLPVPEGGNVHFSARNLQPGNGATGSIQAFEIYRLSDMFSLSSLNVPANIAQDGATAHADITWSWVPLTVSGVAEPMEGAAPLEVAFTGSAAGGTEPYAYHWDFGDGLTSTEQYPRHTYSISRNYSAVMTVKDGLGRMGCAAPLNIKVYIGIEAAASPTSGFTPLTVSFSAAATGGTPPYTYYWHFGDATLSNLQNPSHTYANAGTYNVILNAEDGSGGWGQADPLTIAVTDIPPPVVTSMAKKGSPFKILVNGSNLQNGLSVYINGTPWSKTSWSDTTRLMIKGGGSLKALVPKGTPTNFRFVNPDGGEATIMWNW
jgi:PKD repeat protein